MSVKLKTTAADARLITEIVDRAMRVYAERGIGPDKLSMRMDLSATHLNGCPLDLAKLLAADDFNLMHDVNGIRRHLDRETGQLEDFFRPRCAQPAS